MRLALIGKPQSGKTTIFNAAAGQSEAVGDFSKAVHRAQITVPDSRVDRLDELVKPKKKVYATIEFLDAPGLSGKGKEAGTLEISDDLRQSEAFIMIVDAFSADANPDRDIQTLIDEMILLDCVRIEGIIAKRSRKVKLTGDKSAQKILDLLKKCLAHLEAEKPLIDAEFTADEEKSLRGYQLLTQKPLLVVLNIAENKLDEADSIHDRYSRYVDPGKRELAVMCGKVQAELVGLDNEEKQMFMDELGIKALATDRVIQKSYTLLGLISFLTADTPEARAWTIREGMTAPQAAGVVHSDMERGFIRAEVIAYEDYDRLETMAAIKAAGKHRSEGREYVVRDGDVILFRFNV